MKTFISGGCKNGKSSHAQRLAAARGQEPLYYIATMSPGDGEDVERIRRHRAEREGWGFVTVERPRDIEGILELCDCGGSFLLDSLTALLANEMFSSSGTVNENAGQKITDGLTAVLRGIDSIVIVSDYIYGGAGSHTPLTELYRRSLAAADRLAAELCDVVLEVSYTGVIVHKGAALYKTIL